MTCFCCMFTKLMLHKIYIISICSQFCHHFSNVQRLWFASCPFIQLLMFLSVPHFYLGSQYKAGEQYVITKPFYRYKFLQPAPHNTKCHNFHPLCVDRTESHLVFAIGFQLWVCLCVFFVAEWKPAGESKLNQMLSLFLWMPDRRWESCEWVDTSIRFILALK